MVQSTLVATDVDHQLFWQKWPTPAEARGMSETADGTSHHIVRDSTSKSTATTQQVPDVTETDAPV